MPRPDYIYDIELHAINRLNKCGAQGNDVAASACSALFLLPLFFSLTFSPPSLLNPSLPLFSSFALLSFLSNTHSFLPHQSSPSLSFFPFLSGATHRRHSSSGTHSRSGGGKRGTLLRALYGGSRAPVIEKRKEGRQGQSAWCRTLR